MQNLVTESRNDLIRKIIATAEIRTDQIAELVNLYYNVQDFRIQNANRKRKGKDGEPVVEEIPPEEKSELAQWLDFWMHAGETVIYNKLKQWVEGPLAPPETKWAYSQNGIGPVIAAGLSAHIHVEKADTVSALWKFAGQAPGFDRKVKGQKLCYNARLKVLCFKIGDSFVKVSGKDGATYGRLYVQFKEEEIRRNESGHYAEAAKRELEAKKFKTDNVTKKRLQEGKLSDGHLHARAKRRATKIFLSHYWEQARKAKGLPVTDPYSIQIQNHTGKIEAEKAE
jgi:hypothetical protein